MSEPQTLVACLEEAARSHHGVRFETRAREGFVGYREIADRARGMAGGLQALGVLPGERVAIVASSSLSFYEAFFGVMVAGAVPTPVPPPPRLGPTRDYRERVVAMLTACGASLLLTPPQARISKILGGVPCRLGVIASHDVATEPHRGESAHPDELALVQFSSGTTVEPKPIGLTHRQLLSNVRAILKVLLRAHAREPELIPSGVSWLPLHHDMGLIGGLLTALVHPGPLVLMSPEQFAARPVSWLRAISEHRATISAAPHFAYQLAVDRVRDEELRGVDLSSWLCALDGAESVTAETLARFQQRFEPLGLRKTALTPVYGLAEAGLAVTFSELDSPFRAVAFDSRELGSRGRAVPASEGLRLVSCGRPLAGTSIRIASDGGEPLDEGRLGKVLVRGPSVMEGYLDSEGRTSSEKGADGWRDTGDRGFLFDGELFLFGRYKDVLVLRGCNYAPELIEQSAGEPAGIRPGSVTALAVLGKAGEELWLLAEQCPGLSESARRVAIEAMSARLSERLGLVPHAVVVLENGGLPRTSSGKIRRNEAARRLAGNALPIAAASGPVPTS